MLVGVSCARYDYRMDTVHIDLKNHTVRVGENGMTKEHALSTPEAFSAVSAAWLRAGWDTKYVYGFSWLGRPIIQLPDDMVRMQEVIYQLKPDVIIETGIAHGGSLVFYASLCKAMDRGKVIGVDIEIRPHNRTAIEAHELFSFMTLIEGSSTDEKIVTQVRACIKPTDTVLVILDSRHTKDYVLLELIAYGPMVSVGSYIVATDGIMALVAGGPRTEEDWSWNNPSEAAKEFAATHSEFVIEEPTFPFNEGLVNERVTYWPNAFLKKIS